MIADMHSNNYNEPRKWKAGSTCLAMCQQASLLIELTSVSQKKKTNKKFKKRKETKEEDGWLKYNWPMANNSHVFLTAEWSTLDFSA